MTTHTENHQPDSELTLHDRAPSPLTVGAIANFFKEWTETNLSAMTQKGTSEILEGIVNLLEEVADVAVDAIAQCTNPSGQIFEEIINFFKLDEWPFYQIKTIQPEKGETSRDTLIKLLNG